MGRHIPSAPREYSHHSREDRCNRTEELGSSAWILLHSLLNASYTTMLLYWVDAMLESIKYYMICTGWFCSVVFCQWRMYSLLVCSFLACSLGLRLSAWRTFGQVHNRIHHCTSPSLLMKFYIVVVCDVSRSEYTHALGHYLGGGTSRIYFVILRYRCRRRRCTDGYTSRNWRGSTKACQYIQESSLPMIR